MDGSTRCSNRFGQTMFTVFPSPHHGTQWGPRRRKKMNPLKPWFLWRRSPFSWRFWLDFVCFIFGWIAFGYAGFMFCLIFVVTGPLSVTVEKRVHHVALYPKVAPKRSLKFLKGFCTLSSRLKFWVHIARPSCSLQYFQMIMPQIISRLHQTSNSFNTIGDSYQSVSCHFQATIIHFEKLCFPMAPL